MSRNIKLTVSRIIKLTESAKTCLIVIAFLVSFFIGGMFTLVLHYKIHKNEPTAIDVYRGNTELKVIYVDNIPKDSVVTFKQ